MGVWRDPCDAGAGLYAPADVNTAEELVAAMQGWPGFEVSEPDPVMVGGADGLFVEVRTTPTFAECVNPVLWMPGGNPVDIYPMTNEDDNRYPAHYRILDVKGSVVVIRSGSAQTSPREESQGIARDPDRHAEDQLELNAISNRSR